jgi:hypothetical protein
MRYTSLFSVCFLGVALAVVLGTPGGAWAAGKAQAKQAATLNDGTHGTIAVAPTEEQAKEIYDTARQHYLAVANGDVPSAPAGTVETETRVDTSAVNQVVSSTQGAPQAVDTLSGKPVSNVAMEDIQLVMDVDNITLREVMANVVKQAAAYTGPWTVKWRLAPENSFLLDERVNLTVEARFGDFCDLLTEKVKNLTGVQLFVTAFPAARIILVTDTYY